MKTLTNSFSITQGMVAVRVGTFDGVIIQGGLVEGEDTVGGGFSVEAIAR
jgi:hypothetical protein